MVLGSSLVHIKLVFNVQLYIIGISIDCMYNLHQCSLEGLHWMDYSSFREYMMF